MCRARYILCRMLANIRNYIGHFPLLMLVSVISSEAFGNECQELLDLHGGCLGLYRKNFVGRLKQCCEISTKCCAEYVSVVEINDLYPVTKMKPSSKFCEDTHAVAQNIRQLVEENV